MSDDEVDELLKAVDTSSGEINYTGNGDRQRRRIQIYDDTDACFL